MDQIRQNICPYTTTLQMIVFIKFDKPSMDKISGWTDEWIGSSITICPSPRSKGHNYNLHFVTVQWKVW